MPPHVPHFGIHPTAIGNGRVDKIFGMKQASKQANRHKGESCGAKPTFSPYEFHTFQVGFLHRSSQMHT